MRVVITGGRGFMDELRLYKVLNDAHKLHPIEALAHGGARGADTLGRKWAEFNNIPVTAFEADWQAKGKRAGPIRNAKMLDDFKPDVVFAFPGNEGTWDCMLKAQERGIHIRIG